MDKNIKKLMEVKDCKIEDGLAIYDFMNVIVGKWRMLIIGSIMHEKLRYTDIHKQIPSITPRMLSKELKELEANGIVIRTVKSTIPVTIEYSLTNSAKELEPVFMKILEWGMKHRIATMKSVKGKKQ